MKVGVSHLEGTGTLRGSNILLPAGADRLHESRSEHQSPPWQFGFSQNIPELAKIFIASWKDPSEVCLGFPAEARKVAALAQLTDRRRDPPGGGVPIALAIAVALVRAQR